MPIRNPFRSTTDSRSAFHREISPQTARATAKTSRRPPRAGGPLRYEGGGAQLGRNSLRPRALLDKKTVGGKQPYAIALADRRLLAATSGAGGPDLTALLTRCPEKKKG